MLGLCLFVSQKCYAATIEINDCLGMGMGGNGNIKSHSRSSLVGRSNDANLSWTKSKVLEE